MRRISWWLGACAILVVGEAAAAQGTAASVAARVTAVGIVTDTAHQPIAAADVWLLRGDQTIGRARSDSAGRFSIPGDRSGDYALRVRRFGYQPRTMSLALDPAARSAAPVLVELEPMAAAIAGVEVQAPGLGRDVRLHDFYERKRNNNFGHFFEQADIERLHVQRMSEVLRSVPGVRLLPSNDFGNLVRIRGCKPLVWLDGVRVPGAELDEVASPHDVAAMEVYNSTAGIPVQYFERSNPCGTIVVWTRSQ